MNKCTSLSLQGVSGGNDNHLYDARINNSTKKNHMKTFFATFAKIMPKNLQVFKYYCNYNNRLPSIIYLLQNV